MNIIFECRIGLPMVMPLGRSIQRILHAYTRKIVVCVKRANSELLRWSRHLNDVSPFGLLQISVTGIKILGIKNCKIYNI